MLLQRLLQLLLLLSRRFTLDTNRNFVLCWHQTLQSIKFGLLVLVILEIGGTRTISTQPTLGSLFKSQNASTWTPSQYEDLKFTLYRAVFDISQTGAMAVVNEEMTAGSDLLIPARLGGGKEAGIPTLPANPIDTSIASAYVRVRFKDHGMYSAS